MIARNSVPKYLFQSMYPMMIQTTCCGDYGLGEVLPSSSGSLSKCKHCKEKGNMHRQIISQKLSLCGNGSLREAWCYSPKWKEQGEALKWGHMCRLAGGKCGDIQFKQLFISGPPQALCWLNNGTLSMVPSGFAALSSSEGLPTQSPEAEGQQRADTANPSSGGGGQKRGTRKSPTATQPCRLPAGRTCTSPHLLTHCYPSRN